MQFSSFLIAFFVKLILSGFYFASQTLFLDNDKICIYYAMAGLSHLFVDIMPVTVMLYVHHKNYRTQKEERLIEDEQDREIDGDGDDENLNPNVNTHNNTYGSGEDGQEALDMIIENNNKSSSQFFVL